MPRRTPSTPDTDSSEKRVTRRSLRTAAGDAASPVSKKASPGTPTKSRGKRTTSPSPSGSRGRSRKSKDDTEDEPEVEEDEEPEEEAEEAEEAETKPKSKGRKARTSGTAKKTPAKGRGRKSKAAKEEEEEEEEDEGKEEVEQEAEEEAAAEEESVEEKPKEKVTPRRGKKASGDKEDKKEETTPRRGRGKAQTTPVPEKKPTPRRSRGQVSEEQAPPATAEEDLPVEPDKKDEESVSEAAAELHPAESTEESISKPFPTDDTPAVSVEDTPATISEASIPEAAVTEEQDEEMPDKETQGVKRKHEDDASEPIDPLVSPKRQKTETGFAVSSDKVDDDEFVVINMEDIPPADSDEIKDTAAKMEDSPVEDMEMPEEKTNETDNNSMATFEAAPASLPDEVVPPSSQTLPISTPPTTNAYNGHDSLSPSKQQQSHNDLSHRHSSPSHAAEVDPLLSRTFIPSPEVGLVQDLAKQFTIVTYNVLACCHARRFGVDWLSPHQIELSYRHPRIMQELKYLDADVICLQEVEPEHFADLLQPQFAELGYDGHFIERPDTKLREGEATFYRTSRFSLEYNSGLTLNNLVQRDMALDGVDPQLQMAISAATDQPIVLMLSRLRCNNTGLPLTVANVHFSWTQFQRFDIQCIQVAAATRELQSQSSDGAFIMCGDFNSYPGSAPYQLMLEGYPNDNSVAALQPLNYVPVPPDGQLNSAVNLWWKGFQHTSTNMKSAYRTVMGGDEPQTSYNVSTNSYNQLDYVFVSGDKLQVQGVLAPVQTQEPLPTASIPSDHFSLKAALQFKAVS